LAINSSSPRTVSSDVFRVPISCDPSDLRLSDMSFRAYSSSMDARAVMLAVSDMDPGMGLTAVASKVLTTVEGA
jgi:hypothetical protein